MSHELDRIDARLARIERFVRVLMWAAQQEVRRDEMSQQDIDQLKAKVTANTAVTQSSVLLIQGLVQQLKDAADDPAELQAVIAEIEANTAALAAAVPANTPAA